MKFRNSKVIVLFLALTIVLSFNSFASNGFVFDDSDSRILTERDVEGLPIHVVRLAINEIYARHGRIYETEDLSTYFSSQSWYNPQYKASEFNEEKLFNSVETTNVKFLSDWKDNLEKEEALWEMSNRYGSMSYILPDSNTRYLQDSDVGPLTKEELRYAVNEIYARHGRIYESTDLKSYFLEKIWYTPSLTADEFSEDELFNEYEKENIKFISRVREDSSLQSIVDQTITVDNVAAYTSSLSVNQSNNSNNNNNSYSSSQEAQYSQNQGQTYQNQEVAETNSNEYDNGYYQENEEEIDWMNTNLDGLYTEPDGSINGEALENVLDAMVSSGAEYDSSLFPDKFSKDRQKVVDFLKDYKNHKYQTKYVELSKKALKETLGRSTYAYYGEMKNNMPHGLGMVIDADNGQKLFCGYFKKGKPSGYGIVFDADKKGYNDVYEGDDCGMTTLINIVRFYASGNGFIYDNAGTFVFEGPYLIYEGGLSKNERDGKGTCYTNERKGFGKGTLLYEGKLKNDEYSGSGVLYYPNGSVQYKGDFKNGKYSGKGTLYNKDGSVKYKGKFKKGDIAK